MVKNNILILLVFFLFLVKIFSITFTNFNLFGDEAQYWLWSKNLDLGYFSKPPFLAWVIRAYNEIFGDSFFALKIFPSLIYFLISWCVYNLFLSSGLNKKDALSGCLVFLFIPAVSFSSFLISTDLFLLLFWTLSLNELLKIIKEQNFLRFSFLGIFLGLAFLSKYAAVYFIICLFSLFLFDKNFRKVVINNFLGFCLSISLMLLIFLPNIIWNIENNWITLQHTSDNANFTNIDINLYRGLEFLITQLLMLGPFLVVGGILSLTNINNTQKTLLVFSLPIILIVFIEAIVVRANANWAAPALISLFVFFYIAISNTALKMINLVFNFSFCFIFFFLIGSSYPANIFNRISGLNEYAHKIYETTSKGYKKNIVVSDRLLFSSLNYELRDLNINFYMPHNEGGEITNHFKIVSPLNKNINENFTLIGSPLDINYLENEYKVLKINSPDQKFTKRKLDVYEVVFE